MGLLLFCSVNGTSVYFVEKIGFKAKNIPLRYSEEKVLSLVDESHAGKYESFHMPTNERGWNFGYAFIGLRGPLFVSSFYQAFNGRHLTEFGSKKILEVSYAATGRLRVV